MLIINWMKKNPKTINSDLTAKHAHEIFFELKEAFLPVVDNGKLRGILAHRDIRQAASFVTASQSVHEMNFFNTRLKVKDLMVRNPITLTVNDTVETALRKGSMFRRGFFPVMDGDKLVGTISDRDIITIFYQVIGAEEKLFEITVEISQKINEGFVNEILSTIISSKSFLYSFFIIDHPGSEFTHIHFRLASSNCSNLITGFEDKGYKIIDTNFMD